MTCVLIVCNKTGGTIEGDKKKSLRRPCTIDLVSRYPSKFYAIITAVKFHNMCDTTPSGMVDRMFCMIILPLFSRYQQFFFVHGLV